MKDVERDADDFLDWIEYNQGHFPGPSRDKLIDLYAAIGKEVQLRDPRRRLEKLPTPELLEEVAFACITLRFERFASRVLDCLAPGRREFDLLRRDSVWCQASYSRYRNGTISWPEAVDEATASVLTALYAVRERLQMLVFDLPPMSVSHKVQDKVRYLALLCSLLRDHLDTEMKQTFTK